MCIQRILLNCCSIEVIYLFKFTAFLSTLEYGFYKVDLSALSECKLCTSDLSTIWWYLVSSLSGAGISATLLWCYVTGTLCHLTSLTIHLLVQANNREIIKAPHYRSCVREASPCHDSIRKSNRMGLFSIFWIIYNEWIMQNNIQCVKLRYILQKSR